MHPLQRRHGSSSLVSVMTSLVILFNDKKNEEREVCRDESNRNSKKVVDKPYVAEESFG